MAHIAGRGRYARETYPERSSASASGGVVRSGYDQPVGTFSLAAVLPFAAVIPRNGGGAPLEVVLNGVTAGNILETDYTLALQNNDVNPVAFNAIVVVSFATTPSFPADFFAVDNSLTFGQVAGGGFFGLWRNLTAFVVPGGATKATVRIAYDDNDSGSFAIGGTGIFPQFPGSTLKVAEISSPATTTSTLVAVP